MTAIKLVSMLYDSKLEWFYGAIDSNNKTNNKAKSH